MPEVVGTIRVVHVWAGAGAGAVGAGRATMIAAGSGAAAGGLVGASATGGGYLAGLRARAFIRPDSPLPAQPFGMDPRKAAATFRNNQRALREWQAGASAAKAWRVPRGAFGTYLKSRGGFLDLGMKRRMQSAGWVFGRGPAAAVAHEATLRSESAASFTGRLGVKKGLKVLSDIGKWARGGGLSTSKLSGIGKLFKTIGQRTGLSGGALGGLVRQIGAIGPTALAIGLAGKAVRDVNRATARAGAFQQRLAAAQGLGTGYAASQLLTQERQARYAVELAGRGTYAGEHGLLQQRMIRQRIRRRPGLVAQEWAEWGANLSMGGTKIKSWFYRREDPAIRTARRLHNRRWAAGELPKSWDATRDQLRLREDPYYRALEEAKELRPDLFGGSKRGFMPVSGQYGLAGATATATATQLSKEDLQNERNRIIYAIRLSQGLGP